MVEPEPIPDIPDFPKPIKELQPEDMPDWAEEPEEEQEGIIPTHEEEDCVKKNNPDELLFPQVLQESITIRDDSRGRVIQLTSKCYSVDYLCKFAAECWDYYFPDKNKSEPNYTK